MNQPTLEHLLEQQISRTYGIKQKTENINMSPGIQTADKNASMYDLIKMIQKVVTIAMKELNVEFIPDEDKKKMLKPDQQIDNPFITYKIVSRVPKDEIKPRHRQTLKESTLEKESERIGDVFGQKFKCFIQFNIFSSVYETAEQVMERFEELIFTYTGYFKKNGVSEILFDKQLTDEAYDTFRETMSVRNLLYYIEIEKLFVVFQEKIKEIETYGSLEKEA